MTSTCANCLLFAPSSRTPNAGCCSAFDQSVFSHDIGSDFCEMMQETAKDGIEATIPTSEVVEKREDISFLNRRSHAWYIPLGYYMGHSVALQLSAPGHYKVNVLRVASWCNLISENTFLETQAEEAWAWAKSEIEKEIDGVLPY